MAINNEIDTILNDTFKGMKLAKWGSQGDEITLVKKSKYFGPTITYRLSQGTLSKEITYLWGWVHRKEEVSQDEIGRMSDLQTRIKSHYSDLYSDLEKRTKNITRNCGINKSFEQSNPLLRDQNFIKVARETMQKLLELDDPADIQKVLSKFKPSDQYTMLRAIFMVCEDELHILKDKLELYYKKQEAENDTTRAIRYLGSILAAISGEKISSIQEKKVSPLDMASEIMKKYY